MGLFDNFITNTIQLLSQKTQNNNITDSNRNIHKIKQQLKIIYPQKDTYNPVIPLNIFQTWHSKVLPPKMANNIENIKKNNPRFNYVLFDDAECEAFIRNHFSADVVEAFNKLIPGAYKADLWRYCVLYKKGGIYLDIKYGAMNGFKFINLTEKEHWVADINGNDVYNALIVCKAGNPKLMVAIRQIVENVKRRYYGNSSLDPTGPGLLSRIFTKYEKNTFDMRHQCYFGDVNNRVILLNNIMVFRTYNGYLNDMRISKHNTTVSSIKKKEHYSIMWGKRCIYA